MDPLAHRVAARYLSAAFVPDSWFKERKAYLLRLLKAPLPRKEPRNASYEIWDKIVPFFDKFQKDFEGIVSQDWARQSVADRVESAKGVCRKMASSLDGLEGKSFERETAETQLDFYAHIEICNAFEAKVSTLGDVLKYSWNWDESKLQNLVKKTSRAMTPEVRVYFDNPADHNFQHRYNFLVGRGFYEAAKRLLKREKLEFDFAGWVDRIYAILKTSYTEQALDERGGFREFTVDGMKVVVDDRNLEPEQIQKYVKYIDHAYHLFRAKGLQKAWYGTIFIRCPTCGGVNYNDGGGVAGTYHIEKDVVNIFHKPTSYIVNILTHELGHRYWFQLMKPSQQERFKSLVHVRKQDAIYVRKPELVTSEAKAAVDMAAAPVRDLLNVVRSSRLKWSKIGPEFGEKMVDVGRKFGHGGALIDAIHKAGADVTINPEVKGLFDDAVKAASSLMMACFHFQDDLQTRINRVPDGDDIAKWEKARRLELLGEIEHQLDVAVTSAYVCIDAAVKAYNDREETRKKEHDEKQRQWDEQGKYKVQPVSDYGKSNISEAFAEVFAHYLMNEDMNRDQLESFRSVLSSVSDPVVDAVIRRYCENSQKS